jgi:CCR4-NOT transcription complex subunit 6
MFTPQNMADVYRTSLQNGGNAYYLQNQQRHIARNAASPGHMRAGFHAENMSPSRSPDLASANSNAYGMFNQGHQNLRHGGVASGPAGRIAGLYNFQQQNAASAQRAQQHASQQQDQSVHNTSASLLDQHANYSTHSTPNLTHDELSGDQTSTVQGGQAQQITEHWAEQLKLYKETERAHTMMIENNAPNHYARTKNRENRVIPSDFGSGHLMNGGDASQERTQDRGRPTNLEPLVKRQDWHKMDMCGQGLRVLTQPVFAYTFLNELYIASNKISQIPAAIGALRQLKFLDASNNLITKLPAELGMCVYLEKLLLFDNKIHTLPNEMGSLFRLEMLGIEGNPLDPGLRQEIMKNGTKAVISHLREHAPGKILARHTISMLMSTQYRCLRRQD